jgi:hypothetical protein
MSSDETFRFPARIVLQSVVHHVVVMTDTGTGVSNASNGTRWAWPEPDQFDANHQNACQDIAYGVLWSAILHVEASA